MTVLRIYTVDVSVKAKKIRLVFDVFDRHAMVFIPAKFKRLFAIVNWLEELLVNKADALILSGGQKVLETFRRKPKLCDVILNCPEDYIHGKKRS
jgi:hypothetical protein